MASFCWKAFVAGQRGVEHFIAGLEANLDMVQPGLAEGVQFALRQPYPGGDQVGIEPEVARGADQLRQILRVSGSPPEKPS